MLHQITWQQYLITIIGLSFVYYAYVGIAYCRTDLLNFIRRFSGKPGTQQIQIPESGASAATVMGLAAAEPGIPEDDDLVFGEPEFDDEETPAGSNPRKAAEPIKAEDDPEYAQMVSEVTTLAGVVQESGETKANFEMVFRLLAQKYQALAGTPKQENINSHLLSLGELPFPITAAELNQYWIN